MDDDARVPRGLRHRRHRRKGPEPIRPPTGPNYWLNKCGVASSLSFSSAALTAGRYELVKQSRQGYGKCFGGVCGKVWVARNAEGQLRWLQHVTYNYTVAQGGFPANGLTEVVMLRDLAAASSPSANVMRVLDAFLLPTPARHRLHIVSDYVAHDLVTFMAKGALGPSTVRRMSRELAAAVDYLHARCIVHRNLKRQTILVGAGDSLVVAGFATACRLRPSCCSWLGTPAAPEFQCCTTITVRPPELLLGLREYLPSADLWAVGLLVAAMAIGAEVFWLSTTSEVRWCEAIFKRLGWPTYFHPLSSLPRFASVPLTDSLLSGSRYGWRDAEPVLGPDGVDLVHKLLDLDPSRRLPAQTALQHSYLAEIPVEHTDASSVAPGGRPGRHRDVQNYYGPAHDSSWPQLCLLAAQGRLECRASYQYRDRDLEAERARARWLLVAALAVREFFESQGRHASPDVRREIWSFIAPRRRPLVDCMVGQRHITEKMRAKLLDWLVKVHEDYQLEPVVLFLAADLVDRFLGHNASLPPNRFQLLGCTALLVAAKIESDKRLQPRDFAYGTPTFCTKSQVAEMEVELVSAVGFAAPTWGPFRFLSHYVAVAPVSRRQFHVAQCCLENALLVYSLSRHSPSLLACAAYHLAAQLTPPQEEPRPWWPPILAEEAGRSEGAIVSRAQELHEALSSSLVTDLYALRRKFSKEQYSKAAEIVWPDVAADVGL